MARKNRQAGTGPTEFALLDGMVAAGVAALNSHTSEEHRVLPDEEIVEAIWSAMLDRFWEKRLPTKRQTSDRPRQLHASKAARKLLA